MAVPVGKRGENTLEVFLKAVDLAKYTMEITANTKNFPGRYRPFIDRVNNAAINVASDIWKANNIYIGNGCDPRAFEDRRYLQNRAVTSVNELLFLINMADAMLDKAVKKKAAFWTKEAMHVKSLIIKWRESDRKRG